MGFGDMIDGLGDGLESAAGSVKRGVGEAVNWGTDQAADGLSAVGADGMAEGVRDFGEGVNNRLGGEVAERRLGETEDPKELVHGSPAALEERAGHLAKFSRAFENVGQGLRSLDAGSWRGEAADAFRAKFEPHPKQWLSAADACDTAAKALEAYASTVRWAQQQAQLAIDAWRDAQRLSKQAADAYNAEVETYNQAAQQYNTKALTGQDPGRKPTAPGEFVDPGAAGRETAGSILAEARRQRTDAAHDAQRLVAAALEMAPAKPEFTDRLGADAKDALAGTELNMLHGVGGLVRGGVDAVKLARSVNPMDPYNLTHPAQFMANSNMLLAGLVGTAAHPERLPKAILGSGWSSDPADAGGYLISNLVGGKGADGLEKGAVGASSRAAARDAMTATARRSVSERLADTARSIKCKVFGGDPVDMATGRVSLPQTDVTLPAKLPLLFTRQFESSYRAGRWFGPAWTSTADQRLEIDAEGVVFIREDGSLLAYPHPAPGVPVLPLAGEGHPLTVDTWGDYTVDDPASGRTWFFAAPGGDGDGIALLAQISDRSGQWLSFEYDDRAAPTAIVHSAGYRLGIEHAGNRITALRLADRDQDIELVRFGYDAHGHLAEVTNSSGIPTRFTNDAMGRVTAWTDTNDSSYTYVYDDQDRCVSQSGEAGHLRNTFTYGNPGPDNGHRTVSATNSLGQTTRYQVNRDLQVVAVTAADGAVTRTTYDRHDRPLTETDPMGRTVSHAYDDAGRVVMAVRPDGAYTSVGYDDRGLPVSIRGADGTYTSQRFDEFGNRITVTDTSGATTRFTYDALGNLAGVTDALGVTTTVRCNAAGLPLEVTDPLGAVTRYARDAFGRPTTITDPLGAVTRLEWTIEGRLSRRTAPDGTTESWTYDGEGNCTSHTDPLGAVTRYEYTHFDLMSARTGPDGVRYEFDHDTELRLTKVTNPQGLTWSYDYDRAGRLVAETDFDDRAVTYAHDAAGQLTATTTASGEVVRFERDVLGRVVRKDAAGTVTTYAYDTAGGLARATNPDAVLELRRDETGRVTSETVNGRTLTHTYDVLGRRTSRTTPTGATSTWAYDVAGNRTALTTSGRTLTFTHDAAGRELTRHIGELATLEHTFDPLGRLTKQELTGPADRRLQHRAYTYRADGNLIGVDDDLNGSRRFDLDAAGRVTAVRAADWTESYAYDAAGNQTHASWPTSMPGQEATGERAYTGTRITRAGSVRYEHDAAGRVTLRQKTRLSRKPDTWRYTWDAEDRLTSVITPDGTTWRYRYDPLGRRTAKQRLAADGETVLEQVDFTWDGTTLAEQITHVPGTTEPASTLTWDHNGLRPLTQTERTLLPQEEIDSRFYAIITDLIGTPTELVDDTGTIAGHARTTLWGTTTWIDTPTPLRFPGQYADPETALHYNYFRHYDPETARYLTLDPLGLAPAPNPAGYVHNPHTWTDPIGLTPCHTAQDGSASLGIEGKGLEGKGLEDKPRRWTSDLSHVTGSTSQARNRAIEAIIREEFPDLRLTHKPQYSPFVGHGVSSFREGTQLGPSAFVSRHELRDTIVHEELHHRWWSRGIFGSHHPKDGSGLSDRFYETVQRYGRMRGWEGYEE